MSGGTRVLTAMGTEQLLHQCEREKEAAVNLHASVVAELSTVRSQLDRQTGELAASKSAVETISAELRAARATADELQARLDADARNRNVLAESQAIMDQEMDRARSELERYSNRVVLMAKQVC